MIARRLYWVAMLVLINIALSACDTGDQARGSTPSSTSPSSSPTSMPSSPSSPASPVTVFKELGIEAELPGTGWIDIPYNNEDSEAYGKLSADNQLQFFVFRPYTDIKTDAELKELADGFAYGGTDSTYTVEKAEFLGYPAYVLEGVQNMITPTFTADYQMRVYLFTVKERAYIIGAGAMIDEGGSAQVDMVDKILSSVRVR
jgi:hypothetical protein